MNWMQTSCRTGRSWRKHPAGKQAHVIRLGNNQQTLIPIFTVGKTAAENGLSLLATMTSRRSNVSLRVTLTTGGGHPLLSVTTAQGGSLPLLNEHH